MDLIKQLIAVYNLFDAWLDDNVFAIMGFICEVKYMVSSFFSSILFFFVDGTTYLLSHFFASPISDLAIQSHFLDVHDLPTNETPEATTVVTVGESTDSTNTGFDSASTNPEPTPTSDSTSNSTPGDSVEPVDAAITDVQAVSTPSESAEVVEPVANKDDTTIEDVIQKAEESIAPVTADQQSTQTPAKSTTIEPSTLGNDESRIGSKGVNPVNDSIDLSRIVTHFQYYAPVLAGIVVYLVILVYTFRQSTPASSMFNGKNATPDTAREESQKLQNLRLRLSSVLSFFKKVYSGSLSKKQ